jgi:hypothetical protein
MTSNKLEKLLHLVDSVESVMMHRLANPKFINIYIYVLEFRTAIG